MGRTSGSVMTEEAQAPLRRSSLSSPNSDRNGALTDVATGTGSAGAGALSGGGGVADGWGDAAEVRKNQARGITGAGRGWSDSGRPWGSGRRHWDQGKEGGKTALLAQWALGVSKGEKVIRTQAVWICTPQRQPEMEERSP